MLDTEVGDYGLVAGYASPIGAPRNVFVVADTSIPSRRTSSPARTAWASTCAT